MNFCQEKENDNSILNSKKLNFENDYEIFIQIREFEQNWKMIVIPFIENVEFGQNFEMTKISLMQNAELGQNSDRILE